MNRKSFEPVVPVTGTKSTRVVQEVGHEYDRFPAHDIEESMLVGVEQIFTYCRKTLHDRKAVAVDGWPGIDWTPYVEGLRGAMQGAFVTESRDYTLEPAELEALVGPFLGGDDPVFGTRTTLKMQDLLHTEKVAELRERASATGETVIVVGPGSTAVLGGDAERIVYIELSRAEQQFRSRAGHATNLFSDRVEHPKKAYKRSYFLDWPILEQEAVRLWSQIDVFVDGQRDELPIGLPGKALRESISGLLKRPFRARPWFEPGAWGGQWMMKKLSGLNPEAPNYAWSFELIAPENGILLRDPTGTLLEVQLPTIVKSHPHEVIGSQHQVFRDEFPIRFDYLDTVNGGNLSVQCHPREAYITNNHGEVITQIESYYILDATSDAAVYLGLREENLVAPFRAALERSQEDGTPVVIERFVQRHSASPGDLFLIPPGAVHGAGTGNLILEISSTPYIFTYKLYDWLRLDLDGNPRPINIERGFENLDPSFSGSSVGAQLISRPVVVHDSSGLRAEQFSSSPHHFYTVERYSFTGDEGLSIELDGLDSVLVCNVVSGTGVRWQVEGQQGFYRFAETFVIPAGAGSVTISPIGFHARETPIVIVVARLKPGLRRREHETIEAS